MSRSAYTVAAAASDAICFPVECTNREEFVCDCLDALEALGLECGSGNSPLQLLAMSALRALPSPLAVAVVSRLVKLGDSSLLQPLVQSGLFPLLAFSVAISRP